MKIVDEFKEFIARRQTSWTMAVGIIVGGAFTAIVNSLVTNVIQPLITLVTTVSSTATGGAADGAPRPSTACAGSFPAPPIQYIDLGAFISAIITS